MAHDSLTRSAIILTTEHLDETVSPIAPLADLQANHWLSASCSNPERPDYVGEAQIVSVQEEHSPEGGGADDSRATSSGFAVVPSIISPGIASPISPNQTDPAHSARSDIPSEWMPTPSDQVLVAPQSQTSQAGTDHVQGTSAAPTEQDRDRNSNTPQRVHLSFEHVRDSTGCTPVLSKRLKNEDDDLNPEALGTGFYRPLGQGTIATPLEEPTAERPPTQEVP